MEYKEDEVYILYNVFDYDKRVKRATTEANVKAIYYLKDENDDFLSDEVYNNIILVSSKGMAERQLEAFNIVNKIYNYSFHFNSVIWNKNFNTKFNGEKIIECLLENIVKSTNLIVTSYLNINNTTDTLDEITIFANDITNLIDKYQENN